MSYPGKIGFYRDGLYRQAYKTMSTASSRVVLKAEDSGMSYYVPVWTTGNIILPKISSNYLGLEYTFFVSTQASSDDVKVRCDVNDSSAAIKMNFSSIIDDHTTITPATTHNTGLRVTAVSSVVWMAQALTANAYSWSSAVTSFHGWTTG